MTTTTKKKLSELTPADVIEAALEQIGPEEGYTDTAYFRRPSGLMVGSPGQDVGATCAIGGVEQALWRLTGRVVSDQRRFSVYPDRQRLVSRSTASKLYIETMQILNRVALRTRVASEFTPDGCPIEELTFHAEHGAVVRAFKRALTEAKAS